VEPHTQTQLLPLFLISILAFLIPILTAWFSKKTKFPIPAIVGEILCGILIGKSLLGLIDSTEAIPWLDFLSLFGFAYLMFLSGLEVDINVLTNRLPQRSTIKNSMATQASPIALGFIHFFLTLVLASVISLGLYNTGYINSWIMMTLILSTTSVSIVVPILKENQLSKKFLGQTVLLSALIADFLTMVLITFFVAVSVYGKPGFIILFLILFIGLIIIIYKLHLSNVFDGLIRKIFFFKGILNELEHATTQLKVRGAIALMIIFIVVSQALGFEIILGAFLAGILITLMLGGEKTEQLEMKLDALGYGFFIPIFFISVGINLDIKVFFASQQAWFLLVILVISAFLIKIIPSLIFIKNFSFKEALSSGVLLSSRLSLIIAASTIGLQEGFISEEINAAIVMVAIISCVAAPTIFNRLVEIKSPVQKENIIIVGAGAAGIRFAEKLFEYTDKIKLIALNEEEFTRASLQGLPVDKQLKSIHETLIKSQANRAKALVFTTEEDEFNLNTAIYARNSFAIPNIVSVVNDPGYRDIYKENNIQTVTRIFSVVDMLINKTIFPLSEYHATIGEHEIDIVDVLLQNPEFEGRMIKDIKLPEGVSIAHIIRGDGSIIPHDDTVLHLNDHLTLVGNYKNIQNGIEYLSG